MNVPRRSLPRGEDGPPGPYGPKDCGESLGRGASASRRDRRRGEGFSRRRRCDARPRLALLGVPGITLGIALAAPAPPVPAAPLTGIAPNYAKVDTRRWRCRLCPFDPVQEEGRVSAGLLHVGDAHPRFGRDAGFDEAGVHPDLNADYRRRDEEGRSVEVRAADLGLGSRSASLRIGRGRDWDLRLGHREIPRNVATDGRTPYTGRVSPSLPDDRKRAFDTPGMRGPASAGRSFDYATRRRKNTAGFALALHPDWRFALGYFREARKGTEETFADFLYRSTRLPKPVDDQSEELSARLSFDRRPLLLAAGLRTARFRNADPFLEWENPWPDPVVERGRKALEPDNDAHSFSLVSRVDVGGHSTLNATLDWGRMTQDDAFLPYTTNASLDLDPLPAASLNGRVRTFAGTFRLTSRLGERLRLSLEHRRQERDDDTPTLTLTPVLGDLLVSAPRESRGYGFDKEKTGLRAQYRLGRRLRLTSGVERNRVRRNRLEIAGNEEDRAWIALSARHLQGFGWKLKHTAADRDASEFRHTTADHPLSRRFYQAQRRQRGWRAELDYHHAASGLSLGFDAEHRKNEYPDSIIGLLHDRHRGWGVDFGYAPTRRVHLSGYFLAEERSSATAGSAAVAAPDWWSGTEDRVNTAGFDLDLREVGSERLDLSFGYARSDGTALYETLFREEASIFPALASDLRTWEVRARYRLKDRWTLVVRYRHEDHHSADWALDGVEPDTIRNVLASGRSSPAYSSRFIGVAVEATLP